MNFHVHQCHNWRTPPGGEVLHVPPDWLLDKWTQHRTQLVQTSVLQKLKLKTNLDIFYQTAGIKDHQMATHHGQGEWAEAMIVCLMYFSISETNTSLRCYYCIFTPGISIAINCLPTCSDFRLFPVFCNQELRVPDVWSWTRVTSTHNTEQVRVNKLLYWCLMAV